VDVDPQAKAIAKRVISNSTYASLYFAYFEVADDFLRSNRSRLDEDAEQMLVMLRISMPRLSALNLCRLWDKPGTDRHSLLALTKNIAFAKLAGVRDRLFIRDCRKFGDSDLIAGLTKFRNTDLAHNLPLPVKGEGLTTKRLQEVLRKTQLLIDQVTSILGMAEIHQDEGYQLSKRNSQGFWDLVAHAVVRMRASNE
jgi:hypothetical protein